MPLSPCATAGLSVSNTRFASSPSNATPVTLVLPAVPETVNTPGAGVGPLVSSASSKLTVSVLRFTAALDTAGRTPSTLWPGCAASAAWSSVASLSPGPLIAPPFSSRASAPKVMPSASSSPSATV